MKLMRAVIVLAGLGVLGTLAIQSGEAVAQAAAPPKIGSSLIGKLEGPTIVLDAKTFPKAFKEAPILAAQVKAGKLPPVAQRLPSEPLVLKPLESTGKYGGTWRRAFIGPDVGWPRPAHDTQTEQHGERA